MADMVVSAGMCGELRRKAKRGVSFTALANQYQIPYASVVRHVRGDCHHPISEPPAPLE